MLSLGRVPTTEIEIRKTIKNEMPPIAGVTLLDQRMLLGSFFALEPRLKENFRKSQLIRNEKKTLIRKKEKRKQTMVGAPRRSGLEGRRGDSDALLARSVSGDTARVRSDWPCDFGPPPNLCISKLGLGGDVCDSNRDYVSTLEIGPD